jgi:3-deoxy-manno-octulosonate cytidylyltransferase (CMP-KDO synthetase)
VIPYFRDIEKYEDWLDNYDYYKHIGIYAYRKDILQHLTSLNPGKLEKVEKLEQLRMLEHGYKIRTVITDYQSRSVDTEEDLIEMNEFISHHHLTMEEIDAKM